MSNYSDYYKKISNQSCYNINVTCGGSTGTGQEGSQGPTGPTGPQGLQGPQGPQGPAGSAGSAGARGATGATGAGVPVGGTAGYVLTKNSNANYDTLWAAPSSGSSYGVIKVKKAPLQFNFQTAISTLPASFGTYDVGGADTNTFTISLNTFSYSVNKLPAFIVTAYVYSNESAGHKNVQRNLGSTGSNIGNITITDNVTKLVFENITTTIFPATGDDAAGYSLYIIFNILN